MYLAGMRLTPTLFFVAVVTLGCHRGREVACGTERAQADYCAAHCPSDSHCLADGRCASEVIYMQQPVDDDAGPRIAKDSAETTVGSPVPPQVGWAAAPDSEAFCGGDNGAVGFLHGSADLSRCTSVVAAMVDTLQSKAWAPHKYRVVGFRTAAEGESLAGLRAAALRQALISAGVSPARLVGVDGKLGKREARLEVVGP